MTHATKTGRVYLIGAGPGDPGLITVKGREILGEASVVVFDYLANRGLLEYVRPDAELIYVGKKGGGPGGPVHEMEQDDINALLSEKAMAGNVVARLKGGDPFVFGRGGEEALHLAERGIEFEVVPGVTAAIAAAAYAGIPVTHRGVSASLMILTGHEDPAKGEGPAGSQIDWSRIATGAGTLAVYMGVKNLPRLVESIIAGGRPSTTPVAVISWGTCPRQRVVTGTLADVAERVRSAGIQPPAITIIGEVTALRDRLAWFEKLPLLGKRIVVTRAREQASTLARELSRLGAEVIEFPTIRIEPLRGERLRELDRVIGEIARYRWVIFTSVNTVHTFFDRLTALGMDARSLASCRICAIGPATAEALREKCLTADLVPEKFVAEAIVDALAAAGSIAGARILLPRAQVARDILPDSLRKLGAEVDVVPVYETVPKTDHPQDVLDLVTRGEFDVVTFTSSSTVRNFAEIIGVERAREIGSRVRCASIGPITGQTARELGIPIAIEAAEYTIDGLVQAMVEKLGGTGYIRSSSPPASRRRSDDP